MKFTSETITKAWAIRKAAADKFNCRVMEIHFGLCIKEAMMMAESKTRMKIAEEIAEAADGRVWAPKDEDGIIRVYLRKGYCQIEKDGVNIDAVGGNYFEDVKQIVKNFGLEAYRR